MIVIWILTALISILTGVFLELNKNTWPGWLLLLLALFGMIALGRKLLANSSWPLRALALLLYLGLCIGLVLISWPPVKRVPASDQKNPERTEVVETADGPVRGVVLEEGVELFAGIPYASPPVGELRWKKPRDPKSWSEVLECDQFAPMSMQVQPLPAYSSLAQIVGYHDYEVSPADSWQAEASEDSLYLNIWRPKEIKGKVPVAVFIHGGSLMTGQSWYQDYSGAAFARDGIITVNMGYRLGVFGFLAEEEMLSEEGTAGNFGLLDQIKALQWVQENIEAFGGDPDNVTLIGESAGAVCVDALCVSPLSEGLFQRAILESSTISAKNPPHSYRSFEEALSSGKELLSRHGCSSLAELRSLPAKELAGEQESQHHVTIDGYVLSKSPWELRKEGVHHESALLHGYNAKEAGPFILFDHAALKNYEEKVRSLMGDAAGEILALYHPESDTEADRFWERIYGALFFNYSHYCLNRLEQEAGVPSFEYLFTKDNKRLGCWHSGEMVYAFGMIPEHSSLYSEEDRELSKVMHGCWCAFIKTGDPNSGTDLGFEQSADSERVMEFGEHTGMIKEPDLALYEILDRREGWKGGAR